MSDKMTQATKGEGEGVESAKANRTADEEREERHRLKNAQNKDHLQEYLKMMMKKKGVKPEDLKN